MGSSKSFRFNREPSMKTPIFFTQSLSVSFTTIMDPKRKRYRKYDRIWASSSVSVTRQSTREEMLHCSLEMVILTDPDFDMKRRKGKTLPMLSRTREEKSDSESSIVPNRRVKESWGEDKEEKCWGRQLTKCIRSWLDKHSAFARFRILGEKN